MKLHTLLLALFMTPFLASCQKDGHGSAAPQAISQNTVQGPGDGGGGDTCNGKMIESYKVYITQLPEYQEYVQPILERLYSKNKNVSSETTFLLTPKLKTWYLIDCKLQDIPKERKGLFLDTYQTAVHSNREIFIDSKSYNQMAKEEKAKLLLHEMVMGFYLMKYLSLDEMCKMSGTCSGDFSKVSGWKMFREQAYRPLDSLDHQKIRDVTAWLWSAKESLSLETFRKKIIDNDFDKRFETVTNSGEVENTAVKVSAQAVMRMFKKYNASKSFPKFCGFAKDGNVSTSTCQTSINIEMNESAIKFPKPTPQLHLKMKLFRDADKRLTENEFSFPITSSDSMLTVYKTSFGPIKNAAPILFMSGWPGYPGVETKEGLKSQVLFVMMDVSDPENPEIYEIMSNSYVWYSFEDVPVVQDGVKYIQTNGYKTLIPDESEILFIENELSLPFTNFMEGKSFVSLRPAPVEPHTPPPESSSPAPAKP